jgi:hypothetical protein
MYCARAGAWKVVLSSSTCLEYGQMSRLALPSLHYYYCYYRCALAVAEAMGSRAITGGSSANATTSIGSSQLLPRPL